MRYYVELYQQTGPAVGELRISLRTQNSSLILHAMQFFKLWSKMEHGYRPETVSAVEDGKFIKKLTFSGEADTEQITEAISEYINVFDEAMKAFFYQIDEPKAAVVEVERIHKDYLKSSSLPL